MWIGYIAFKREVFVPEGEDILYFRVDLHVGELAGCARKLKIRLLKMVCIQVGISKAVDKITRLKVANLSQHDGQEGIGGNIERDTQKDIGTALIQLA